MRMRFTIAATLVYLAPISSATAEILNIGDAAPPLTVSSWVKGEKVERMDADKTYVVEFWATWCGPCRASIPHLTELAHRYKDKGVRFIGVAVWENEPQEVPPFVEEMGDKMDYSVALDSVPADGKRGDGAMAKAWMEAAEEHGIPAAFVIQKGKIAWIGHPLRMDEPLAKIISGDWEPSELAKERLVAKAQESKMRLFRSQVYKPYQARDYTGTVAAIDEVLKGNPELTDRFEMPKFVSLCRSGNIDAGLVIGSALLEKHHDNADALNNLAWDIIDPEEVEKPDPQVAQLALKAARRAVELTNNAEPNYIDTLAEALFQTGDAKAAVAAEEQVLKLLGDKAEDASEELKEFQDHLERYRKGLSSESTGG